MEQEMKKKTDWFPSSVNPYRVGVYQVFTPNSSANKYAYYDKKGWRLCGGTIKQAEKEKHHESTLSSMNLFASKWRGFTEEQK
jgi:hypothetical protein